MAMAQSVGVDLNEDDASELGCIAMNKLRHVVLMAMQFSQNENSAGITVQHFAKAEEQMGSTGVGQESVFRETSFKYAGGVSIIDEGPEVDLYASVTQDNIANMVMENTDPILNVHHLRPYEFIPSRCNLASAPDSDLSDDDVAGCCEKNRVENLKAVADEMNASDFAESNPGPSNTVSVDDNTSQPANVVNDNNESSSLMNENSDSTDEDEFDQTVTKLSNESASDLFNIKVENDDPVAEELGESDITGDADTAKLAPEWSSYLQMLIEHVVQNVHKESSCAVSPNFRRILKDIRRNGIQPAFHLLCDTFRDYLHNSTLSKESIMNILSVADALSSSIIELTLSQMTDLGCVLIEIIVLPPPCEVHHSLTCVFMKIMKNCNELLTWTCTYVTELMKGISETPFEQINDPLKSTMHGALCLANGLEELNIQVAQEFGWHTSVLNFSQQHSLVFDGQSYTPSSEDSLLEEEILKFYHNFMKNYTILVPPAELLRVRECITTMYGERFYSFAPTAPTITTVLSNKTSHPKTKSSTRKARCVFRKILYKDKEIVVPYRKLV